MQKSIELICNTKKVHDCNHTSVCDQWLYPMLHAKHSVPGLGFSMQLSNAGTYLFGYQLSTESKEREKAD